MKIWLLKFIHKIQGHKGSYYDKDFNWCLKCHLLEKVRSENKNNSKSSKTESKSYATIHNQSNKRSS